MAFVRGFSCALSAKWLLLWLVCSRLCSQVHTSSDFALNTSVCGGTNVVSARTLDQTSDLRTVVEVIPRRTVFHEPPSASTIASLGWTSAAPMAVAATAAPTVTTPSSQDVVWAAKYGFVALNVVGTNFAIDGLNDQGLSASLLHLFESRYPIPDKSKPVVTSICSYLLGNFAEVDDIRSSMRSIQFGEFDGKFVALGDTIGQLALGRATFHVAVHDARGKSLVIEFVDGKVQVYDNPNGVLTNDPPLTMQLQELQENGFVNIPGGFGSQERFIRLSILNRVQAASCPAAATASPSSAPAATASSSNISYLTATEEQQVIMRAQRLLQTVVQPVVDRDPTQWSIIRDHHRKKLYFQSLQNSLLRVVDLNALNFDDVASRRLINLVPDKRTWCINETPGLLDPSNHLKTKDILPRDQVKRLLANQRSVFELNELSEPAPDSAPEPMDSETRESKLNDRQTQASTLMFLAGGVAGVVLMAFVNFFSHRRPMRHGYLPVK